MGGRPAFVLTREHGPAADRVRIGNVTNRDVVTVDTEVLPLHPPGTDVGSVPNAVPTGARVSDSVPRTYLGVPEG